MTKLATCSACRGFLPHAAERCPHCEASVVPARSTLVKVGIGALAVAGGTIAVITLAACYGPAFRECRPGQQPSSDHCFVEKYTPQPMKDGGL